MTTSKLPKLTHGGHTIPASRRNTDRYRIQRGQLTGHWLIQDTDSGLYVARYDRNQKGEAHRDLDELNGGQIA